MPAAAVGDDVVGRTKHTLRRSNPDGTISTLLSERPLHRYDDATAAWDEFDNSLWRATAAGYSYEAGDDGEVVSFDRAADVAAGGPVLRVAADAASVTLSAVGAEPTVSQAAGDAIRYDEAWPGVDLRYRVDNELVKEDIVLERAPRDQNGATFRFDLALRGVMASLRADNGVVFSDLSGKPVFRMPRPFMLDANSAEPEARFTDSVDVTLASLGAGRVRLTYAADLKWLRAPERRYPVVLDPSVETVVYGPSGAVAQSVPIYEGTPATNYEAHPDLDVGLRSDGKRRDSLLRFPELDNVPRDSAIIGATLKLYAVEGPLGCRLPRAG